MECRRVAPDDVLDEGVGVYRGWLCVVSSGVALVFGVQGSGAAPGSCQGTRDLL